MLTAVATGVLFGLSAGVAPGPLLTLVVTQTLEHGPREGMKVAAAPLVTDLPLVALVAWAAARFGDLDPLLGAVSLAGAGFVAWMGVGSLRTRALALDAEDRRAPRSLARGIAVNALSPHPYLFWAGVGLPTMAGAGGAAAAAGFAVSFLVVLVSSKTLLAMLVGRARRRVTGRIYVWTMRALGVLLLAFAAALARQGLERVSHRPAAAPPGPPASARLVTGPDRDPRALSGRGDSTRSQSSTISTS